MTMSRAGPAAFWSALAETSLALPDAALIAEVRAEGLDPRAEAERARGVMRAAGKRYRQRLLRAAAAEWEEARQSLSTRWVELPDAADDRRALLASLFAQHPAMQDAFLTVQHRSFKELTDADVESCLAQLAELGLLDGEEDEP